MKRYFTKGHIDGKISTCKHIELHYQIGRCNKIIPQSHTHQNNRNDHNDNSECWGKLGKPGSFIHYGWQHKMTQPL